MEKMNKNQEELERIEKKYHLSHKNEGTWVKWSVVDNKNIVRFVGLYKDAKRWISLRRNK